MSVPDLPSSPPDRSLARDTGSVAVLVFGNAGHGKTTFSRMLMAALHSSGIYAVDRPFAGPVKDIAAALLGVTRASLDTAEGKAAVVYGRPVRAWLQYFGTDLGRDVVHQDVWVHRFVEAHCAFVSERGCGVSIASDARFRNELVVVRDLMERDASRAALLGYPPPSPGIVYAVRILRPSVPVDLSHQSESEVASGGGFRFDATVHNEGGLVMLRQSAAAIAALLAARLRMGISSS